jgi:hypothetical protein
LSWLEVKYINLLSNRLLKFKRKSAVLFNFRCPLCGDSETHKNKARGYIYQRSGSFWFTCHNCTRSLIFTRFLKEIDSGLYDEYLADLITDKKENLKVYEPPPAPKVENTEIKLKSIRQLLPRHPARKYLEGRKIPSKHFGNLYYCPEFKAWTNSFIPDKFESLEYEEERIVLPFLDPACKMFGFQGRALDPNAKVRYLAIMLDETQPKIYGLDRVDFNRTYFITEGPLDSLFLSNAIATGGGKITSELFKVGCNIENAVICYDNEPRNKDVVANIRKAVMTNFRVVIWPEGHRHKDINDMVIAGWTPEQVERLLRKHTYKGLQAQLEFTRWTKC